MELADNLSHDFGKYLIYSLLFFGVLGWIENYYLVRLDGRIKRGFKVWSKPIPEHLSKYLYSLHQNVVEYRKVGFSRVLSAFIRVENNEAIIQFRKPHWTSGLAYIGYIDLNAVNPQLEYRGSIFGYIPILIVSVLAILAASPAVFVILFFGIMLYINFSIETKAIDGFIREKLSK